MHSEKNLNMMTIPFFKKNGENISWNIPYCLMPNHIHLIAVPSRKETLRTAFGQWFFCSKAGTKTW